MYRYSGLSQGQYISNNIICWLNRDVRNVCIPSTLNYANVWHRDQLFCIINSSCGECTLMHYKQCTVTEIYQESRRLWLYCCSRRQECSARTRTWWVCWVRRRSPTRNPWCRTGCCWSVSLSLFHCVLLIC